MGPVFIGPDLFKSYNPSKLFAFDAIIFRKEQSYVK